MRTTVLFLCLLSCACSSTHVDGGSSPNTPPPDDTDKPDANIDIEDPPPMTTREPLEHRPAEVTCDHTRAGAADMMPSSAPAAGAGGAPEPPVECTVDADCTAGDNGRCEDLRGLKMCTYDQCFADADCPGAGPCGCESGFWSDWNKCLAGNCQVDADCGPGGYCSPSFGECGNYSGVIAYYCHTKSDACVDDADCVDGPGPGYCMFRPEVAHWACSYSHCVG